MANTAVAQQGTTDQVWSSPAESAGGGHLRFENIDALRAFAALAVLMQHTLEIAGPKLFLPFSLQVFNLGQFGVTVFLLVSGYVIPLSMERTQNLKFFWISRAFRLYPLYWFSILVAYVFFKLHLPLNRLMSGSGHSVWLWNATMLQQFAGKTNVIPLYWTLTNEMLFYVSCTFLFWRGWLRKTSAVCFVASLCLLAVFTIVPIVTRHRLPGGYAFLFATTFFGTLFYREHMGEISRKDLMRQLAFLAPVAIALIYVNFNLFPRTELPFSASCVLVTYGAAYLFFMLMVRVRVEWSKAVLYLGLISYSIYLIHPAFLMAADFVPTAAGKVIFIVGGVLAASSTTYFLIEKPFINRSKRLVAKLRLTWR